MKHRVTLPMTFESLDGKSMAHLNVTFEAEGETIQDVADRVACALEKLTKKRTYKSE